MLGFNLGTGRNKKLSVLCLGSHCDDIEIGCGGTVLKLIRQFDSLAFRWVVFSSNEERAAEALKSAKQFLKGAKEKAIAIEKFRDGFFPYIGGQIKEYFETLKSEFRPDLIFTHYRQDLHQDHRVISELTWNTFRDHLVMEYEIPKYDGDLGQPNFFVPLSPKICQAKIKYLMTLFESQRDKQWLSDQTFLALMKIRGIESNAPESYAEAFYLRKCLLSL